MAYSNMDKRVGSNIKKLRNLKGWTQVQLADRVGLYSTSLCQYESGKYSMKIQLLVDIATALEVAPIALFSETDEYISNMDGKVDEFVNRVMEKFDSLE